MCATTGAPLCSPDTLSSSFLIVSFDKWFALLEMSPTFPQLPHIFCRAPPPPLGETSWFSAQPNFSWTTDQGRPLPWSLLPWSQILFLQRTYHCLWCCVCVSIWSVSCLLLEHRFGEKVVPSSVGPEYAFVKQMNKKWSKKDSASRHHNSLDPGSKIWGGSWNDDQRKWSTCEHYLSL